MRRRLSFPRVAIPLMATLCCVPAFQLPADAAVTYSLYGLDFSPYVDGQDPNINPQVTLQQIQTRMGIVAQYTTWIRSFSSTNGLENIPPVARSFGLKVAAGAWIGRDLTANGKEIANLITAANAGQIDVAIVGSEALLRNDVSESQLIAYMQQVRQAIPANIPVVTADTSDTLLTHPNVVAASAFVFPNIYPFWQGNSISNAVCALASTYQDLVAAANGKQVIISETGWPSAGNSVNAAVPSPANAAQYFQQFTSWARAANVSYFYFDALDESWKAKYSEGPQGAHWGIWDKYGAMKPGMQAVFNGQTQIVNCNGVIGGPGTPSISFVFAPPCGDATDPLEGQVLHVAPANYAVAIYIKVAGGWWTKPTFMNPVTQILSDGSWSSVINTGGGDPFATDIAAFLISGGYIPPIASGNPSLPVVTSVAQTQATRTQRSISGRITDGAGNPMGGIGVALSGLDNGTANSSPNGYYSFPSLASSGPDTVTPAGAGYNFSPSSRTFSNFTSGQVANFVASPAPTAPVVVSVTPINMSGLQQSFSATYSESNGVGDLNAVYLLFNSQLSAAGACLVLYLPSSNTLYLFNDAGNGVVPGSITPGASGTLSNGQCSVANAGSVSVAGTNLTLPVAVTFPQTFGGVKNVYGNAVNNEGEASGWRALGTWTPSPSQAPAVVSVNPINGSGSPRTFTATFSEASGVGDLSTVYWLFHSQLSASRGCPVVYLPSSNALYLFNDGGTGLTPGAINPGNAGTLSNGQCIVSNAGSATLSATNLQLPLTIAFAQTFGGAKNVYAYAINNEGMASGWQIPGTWTPWPAQAPTVVSIAPINGSGSPQTFTATFSELSGVGDLNTVYWIVNSQLIVSGGCAVAYLPSSNTLYLFNDSGSGFVPGAISPGAAGALSNGQCNVSNAGSATLSATNLQLPLTISFAQTFAGSKNVYAYAANNEGMNSGWQMLGTWLPF